MQNSTFDNFLATLIIVIIFIAFWCAIGYLVSFLTGWLALARRFKKQSEPYGEIRSAGPFFYTVYMRFWGHYSSVIRLTAASDALYASVLFLFRIGHPPLRIPWDEIRFGRTKFFFRTNIVLTLGNAEKIPMCISLRMARNLGILDRCPE
ncbi:MAG: hypothetical protein ABR860_09470 [Terracidiphilus sp.]|jgi:hypothetical protein